MELQTELRASETQHQLQALQAELGDSQDQLTATLAEAAREQQRAAAENKAVRATLSAALADKDAANRQLKQYHVLEAERAAELSALSDTVEQASV